MVIWASPSLPFVCISTSSLELFAVRQSRLSSTKASNTATKASPPDIDVWCGASRCKTTESTRSSLPTTKSSITTSALASLLNLLILSPLCKVKWVNCEFNRYMLADWESLKDSGCQIFKRSILQNPHPSNHRSYERYRA